MIVAIVPAAGKSQRMGQPKLLLPLGRRRVIEHVLSALAESKVDQTVVVVPPRAVELVAVAEGCNAVVVRLLNQTSDMRSTIEYGLTYAEDTWGTDQLSGFLVAPADQPTVCPATVDHLIQRSRVSSAKVFIPTFKGRRGHPVLFLWELATQVRSIPPDHGLNHLVTQLGHDVEECPTDTAGVLEDLDTPEDYERLKKGQ